MIWCCWFILIVLVKLKKERLDVENMRYKLERITFHDALEKSNLKIVPRAIYFQGKFHYKIGKIVRDILKNKSQYISCQKLLLALAKSNFQRFFLTISNLRDQITINYSVISSKAVNRPNIPTQIGLRCLRNYISHWKFFLNHYNNIHPCEIVSHDWNQISSFWHNF